MKTLIALVVMVAFATTLADPFSDSKNWNTVRVGGISNMVWIKEGQGRVFINNRIYYKDGSGIESALLEKRGGTSMAFDRWGNKLVGSDSGLAFLSKTDTTFFLRDQYVMDVCIDADSDYIIIGTDKCAARSKPGPDHKPTTWVNVLSASVHKVKGEKGYAWALNSRNVYSLVPGGTEWKSDATFGTPISGDFDLNGNFWLSFQRQTYGLDSVNSGLAKFDGNSWKEYFSRNYERFAGDSGFLGDIGIDGDNNLWFAGDIGVGKVDLSTMSMTKVLPGTYPWQPQGSRPTLAITEKHRVIFGGPYYWVENIDPSASVRYSYVPVVRRTVADQKVVGVFDPLGRKIAVIPNSNSFSSHRPSAGNYFVWPANNGKVKKLPVIR
jgi:hypothetical protein